MNKLDAENLYASMLHRWSTGDISNFERDYAEDIVADFDGDLLNLQNLKDRLLFFHEHFQIIQNKIHDFLYDENTLAVRFEIEIKIRKTGELMQNEFFWFYEVKENQVQKYWSITNQSFGFKNPNQI